MRLPHSYIDGHGGDVKMTPMIDVVFLLLIFFVCTASFQIAEDVLPTYLRVAGSTTPDVSVDEPAWEQIVIAIQIVDGAAAWTINETPCSDLAHVRHVLSEMARIDTDVAVILDADPSTPLFHVIDVYDTCRLVGFERVQFATSVGNVREYQKP